MHGSRPRRGTRGKRGLPGARRGFGYGVTSYAELLDEVAPPPPLVGRTGVGITPVLCNGRSGVRFKLALIRLRSQCN